MSSGNTNREGEKRKDSENRTKSGKIILLVAPSGTGKSTMARRLLGEFDQIRFSVSATTRPPRKDEKNGRDYYFLSVEKFQEKVAAGEFLEWEEFYNGYRYGTLRSDVENQLNKGYFILLDIEVLGAENIKKMYGDNVLAIFLKPPSMKTLEKRLKKRGTESAEMLQTRLERAERELAYAERFDLVVVNDDLETAYQTIYNAVRKFLNH